MGLVRSAKLLSDALKNEPKVTKHFVERCKDRDLDSDKILSIIISNDILGFVEQNHNLYKIWFVYSKDKDLVVIVSIDTSQHAKLVTVFPSDAERRQRRG